MADRVGQLSAKVDAATAALTRATRRLSAVVGRVDALGSRAMRSAAVPLPALAIGATDVAVVWAVLMPDTSYQAFPSVAGGALVAGKLLTTVKLTSRTVDGCTVTVTNISAGAIADASGVLWVLAVNPSS